MLEFNGIFVFLCDLVACVLCARATELPGHPRKGGKGKGEAGGATLCGLPNETQRGSAGSAEQT